MDFSVFGRNNLSFEIKIFLKTHKKPTNLKANGTATSNYRRVMEVSGASLLLLLFLTFSFTRAQHYQVRLPGITGNTPGPTAVNKNGAALASVSANIMGGQSTLSSSRQAMAATTSNFVYEGARHRSRSMWNGMLRLKCRSCTMSAA